jgi:subtilisin family serine protease
VTGTSFAAPYVAGAIAAYASEYSVPTREAWRMVIGQSLPVINVGKNVNTTTRLVHMFSGEAFGRTATAIVRPKADTTSR